MNRKSGQFISLVTDFKNYRLIGEKSEGIKYLIENGYSVPSTYVCSSEAYERYLQGDPSLMEILEEELESKIDADEIYSVRSSATLKDNPSYSFAGQFQTFLNVKGLDQILESIRKVWESTKSNRATIYSDKSVIHLNKIRMAVIIQEMVKAKISGAIFTRNPMNGKDEVIIEAVDGLGDSLLQGEINPYRGVYKWGEWIEQPNIHGMPISLIEAVIQKAKILERKRKTPLNLEWAYDGHSLYWLQLREITDLSGLKFYSNKMAKEFLPGTIKPLVWSVNIPLVCGAWVRLLSELVGDLNIAPQDLARPFYYRAYFDMGIIGDVFEAFDMPREGLEVLMGYGTNAPEKPSFKPGPKSLKHLPKLILFGIDKVFFGRKMRKFIKRNDEALKKLRSNDLETTGASETIKKIEELYEYNKKAAYFVIVSQLLNALYNKILMNQLAKKGRKLEDLDLGYTDYRDIDPNWEIRKLHQEYMKLPEDTKEQLASFLKDEEEGSRDEVLNRFIRSFEDFVFRFGHLSDQGNDFSSVPWRERRRFILDMAVNYSGPRYPPMTKEGWDKPFRESGFFLNWAYQKARESLEFKERISFNYTRSYGIFRDYFLHLARLFKKKGYILDLEDIFYFTFDEIRKIVEEGRLSNRLSKNLHKRKQEIAEYQNVELPEEIYGDEPPLPVRRDSEVKILSGIPASGGYYTGNTCIVKSVHDFPKVTGGVVIVIPYSDISWIPILTKAGAVISESGGILSHSAVISREYGIPSVVGVKGACNLGDGREVNVDGFSGSITVH